MLPLQLLLVLVLRNDRRKQLRKLLNYMHKRSQESLRTPQVCCTPFFLSFYHIIDLQKKKKSEKDTNTPPLSLPPPKKTVFVAIVVSDFDVHIQRYLGGLCCDSTSLCSLTEAYS
jgi:hypothetical protein